jgi:hypothetical protein
MLCIMTTFFIELNKPRSNLTVDLTSAESDQIPVGADFVLECKNLRNSFHLEGFDHSWCLIDLK